MWGGHRLFGHSWEVLTRIKSNFLIKRRPVVETAQDFRIVEVATTSVSRKIPDIQHRRLFCSHPTFPGS